MILVKNVTIVVTLDLSMEITKTLIMKVNRGLSDIIIDYGDT